MSWDFDLCDPVTKKVLETEEKHEIKGGTYCVGGTTEMALNVTYNYSDIIIANGEFESNWSVSIGRNPIRDAYGHAKHEYPLKLSKKGKKNGK